MRIGQVVAHRSSLILEPGFLWMLWIAVGFGVAAIIAQWIKLLRKTSRPLFAMWATVEESRWDVGV
jgi:hypothetical protein